MEPIAENLALELFKKYAESVVSQSTDFIFLRSPITKAQTIESTRPVPCCIKDKTIKIKAEPNAPDKEFSLDSVEQISWGNFDGPTGALKFIQLTIKGDKPIVLHGQVDIMELWFDHMCMKLNKQPEPETETSKSKIEIFKSAIKYANKPFPEHVVEIPPPPKDYNFVTKLEIK